MYQRTKKQFLFGWLSTNKCLRVHFLLLLLSTARNAVHSLLLCNHNISLRPAAHLPLLINCSSIYFVLHTIQTRHPLFCHFIVTINSLSLLTILRTSSSVILLVHGILSALRYIHISKASNVMSQNAFTKLKKK